MVIQRRLNEPAHCQCWLTLPVASELRQPMRNQRIRIVGDEGTVYFTGYLAEVPIPEYAGHALEGPRFRLEIRATSDESLLDQVGTSSSTAIAGLKAGALIAALVKKTGSSALNSESLTLDAAVSRFDQRAGTLFSDNAGRIASEVRAAYRALDGELSLSAIPVAVHSLEEEDGSLSLSGLSLTRSEGRFVANDITVCGEEEPAEYVTELFQGDGVSSQFYLSHRPYSLAGSRATIIQEQFDGPGIDTRGWANTGVQGYMALGPGGLAMQGGTGDDGDVQLTWLTPVEMGGTLLLEAGGVTLAKGSAGTMAAFYSGGGMQENCTAGFVVSPEGAGNAVSIQPMLLGTPVGTVYSMDTANQYTLRLRVHCKECEREFATHRSMDGGIPVTAGGDCNDASADLLFEIQEFVNGVAGMPVTLYDGQIANLPSSCSVVAASSLNLQGSMRSLGLMDLGSSWVKSACPGESSRVRRLGSAAQSAECRVESNGTLVFYPGFTPEVGERVQVSYRAVRRAVGRATNETEQQQLAEAGLPAVSAWIGSVTNPAARSSRDCRNGAAVLARSAATANSLLSGRYECTGASLDGDVWPGDALQINTPSAALNAQVIVRAVKLTYASTCPDLVHYTISFANDWAEHLAIKTSSNVPDDAWLPAPVSPSYAANLSELAVVAIDGNAVTVNTGIAAPAGGGFEVRRRDNCFMPGTDPDVVLRGSQSTLTLTRASASERFYIRMFNEATPPNYSEFSAALIFNLPLS
jgi:hypothetical protein